MSKKSIQYSVDFERFWGIYPPLRKSKKADAYAAWEKVLSDGASPEIILSAVVLFSQSNVGLGKYCPGPLPWINQKRWEDDPQSWETMDETQDPRGNISLLPESSAEEFNAAVAMGVTALAEAFRQKISKVTIDAYAVALEGMRPAEIESACVGLLKINKFMPTAAEIREAAGAELELEKKAMMRQSHRVKSYKQLSTISAENGDLKQAAAYLIMAKEAEAGRKLPIHESAPMWKEFLSGLRSQYEEIDYLTACAPSLRITQQREREIVGSDESPTDDGCSEKEFERRRSEFLEEVRQEMMAAQADDGGT